MTFAIYPSLAGRVVLITGGASGIGAEMVGQFAQNGARVAFLDIQDEAARALVADLAAQCPHAPLFLHCDLTDIPALRAAIQRGARGAGADHRAGQQRRQRPAPSKPRGDPGILGPHARA